MRQGGYRIRRRVTRPAFRALRRCAGQLKRIRALREFEKRPLFDSTLLDDLLFAQPMNILVRWARFRGSRQAVAEHRTTIVVVNYNTLDVLRSTVSAIRRFTDPSVELMVVDNGSRDGSREWIKRQGDIRGVLLPTNMGHGRALDIGICRAATARVLLLDSDAFPVADDWLSMLTGPMEAVGVLAVGMRGRRDRLHPCCALIDRSYYLSTGVSMSVYDGQLKPGASPELGVNVWDCAELFSSTLNGDNMRLISATPTPYGGQLIGGKVYHHGAYTTRVGSGDASGTKDRESWRAAVAAYLS